jgi:hypothetical protein
MKRIEVLVFKGCPHVDATLRRVRAALAATCVQGDVDLIYVEDHEHAEQLRFVGSPTVRVDGTDVDPHVVDRRDFGLQCRLYSVGEGLEGLPPEEWIAAALRA